MTLFFFFSLLFRSAFFLKHPSFPPKGWAILLPKCSMFTQVRSNGQPIVYLPTPVLLLSSFLLLFWTVRIVSPFPLWNHLDVFFSQFFRFSEEPELRYTLPGSFGFSRGEFPFPKRFQALLNSKDEACPSLFFPPFAADASR